MLTRIFVFCELDECISNLSLLQPAISQHGNMSEERLNTLHIDNVQCSTSR